MASTSSRFARFGKTFAILAVVGGLVGAFLFATVWVRMFDLQVLPEDIRDFVAIEKIKGRTIATTDRVLLASEYAQLNFNHPGYHTATLDLHRTGGGSLVVVELQPLPGYLDIVMDPQPEIDVLVDGRRLDSWTDIELDKGSYVVAVTRRNVELTATQVDIEGLGKRQTLTFDLTQFSSQLRVSTKPNTAALTLNGEFVGYGSFSGGMPIGPHELVIEYEHYQTATVSFVTSQDELLDLGVVQLEPLPIKVALTTQPTGASVLLNDDFIGESDLNFFVPPGSAYDLVVFKPGHAKRHVRFQPAIGKDFSRHFALEQDTIVVNVEVTPDGNISVNGIDQGVAPQTLTVYANDVITARSQGRVAQSTNVKPEDGNVQALRFELLEPAAHAFKHAEETSSIQGGLKLEKFPPVTFKLPLDDEQTNTALVQLSRPFYIGTTEVTVKAYQQFNSSHGGKPNEPVVNVSWLEAVRFCNWLSHENELEPFYKINALGLVDSTNSHALGFRLPTEAEWEASASYDWRLKRTFGPHEWGSNPTPSLAGANLAGSERANTTRNFITKYEDNFVAVSPVAVHAANFNRVHDLAGNVSEWVHDYYAPRRITNTEPDYMGPRAGIDHIVKGGNFTTFNQDELKTSYRGFVATKSPSVGFRIARWIY